MLKELVMEVQRMRSELEKLTEEVGGITQLMAEQGEIVFIVTFEANSNPLM
jgi:hypothetical protein